MQLGLWLDRPLSVAGKLAVAAENGIETVLTDIKRDLLVIPSLAIHLNREVNKGIELNPQNDTLPLFGGSEADLLELAAQSVAKSIKRASRTVAKTAEQLSALIGRFKTDKPALHGAD